MLQNGGQERKMPQKSFLVFFHIDTKYIKLDWNSEKFLIFWSTLLATDQTYNGLKLGNLLGPTTKIQIFDQIPKF